MSSSINEAISRSAKAGEGSTGVWGAVTYGLYSKDGTVSLIGGARGSQFDPR